MEVAADIVLLVNQLYPSVHAPEILDALLLVIEQQAQGPAGIAVGQAFRAGGGVARLVSLLRQQESAPETIQLTLAVLGNLCCNAVDAGAAATRRELLQCTHGADSLVACLRVEADEDVQRLAVGTLQNLLNEPTWAAYVAHGGVCLDIERLLEHSDASIVRYASGCLVNLRAAMGRTGRALTVSAAAENAIRERRLRHQMEALRMRWAKRCIKAAARSMPQSIRKRRIAAGRQAAKRVGTRQEQQQQEQRQEQRLKQRQPPRRRPPSPPPQQQQPRRTLREQLARLRDDPSALAEIASELTSSDGRISHAARPAGHRDLPSNVAVPGSLRATSQLPTTTIVDAPSSSSSLLLPDEQAAKIEQKLHKPTAPAEGRHAHSAGERAHGEAHGEAFMPHRRWRWWRPVVAVLTRTHRGNSMSDAAIGANGTGALLKAADGDALAKLLFDLGRRLEKAPGDSAIALCGELRASGAVAVISNLLTHEAAQIHQLAINLVGNLVSGAVDPHADLSKRELKQARAFDHLLPYLFSTDEATLLPTLVAIQSMCLEIEYVNKLRGAGGIKRLQHIAGLAAPQLRQYAQGCLDNARAVTIIDTMQRKVWKTEAEATTVLEVFVRRWRARRADGVHASALASKVEHHRVEQRPLPMTPAERWIPPGGSARGAHDDAHDVGSTRPPPPLAKVGVVTSISTTNALMRSSDARGALVAKSVHASTAVEAKPARGSKVGWGSSVASLASRSRRFSSVGSAASLQPFNDLEIASHVPPIAAPPCLQALGIDVVVESRGIDVMVESSSPKVIFQPLLSVTPASAEPAPKPPSEDLPLEVSSISDISISSVLARRAYRWGENTQVRRGAAAVGVATRTHYVALRGCLRRWHRWSDVGKEQKKSLDHRTLVVQLHLALRKWRLWVTVTQRRAREMGLRARAVQLRAAVRSRMAAWRQWAADTCRLGAAVQRKQLQLLLGQAATAHHEARQARCVSRALHLWTCVAHLRAQMLGRLRNALAKWKEAELNAGFCAWCFHVAHAAASGTTPAVLRELRRLSDTHVQSSRLRRGWSWLHARVMAKDALRSEMAARRRAAMSRHQAANFLWRTQAIGAVFCALTVLSERAKRQRGIERASAQIAHRRTCKLLGHGHCTWRHRATQLSEWRERQPILTARASWYYRDMCLRHGWRALLLPKILARFELAWTQFHRAKPSRLLSRGWSAWHGMCLATAERQAVSLSIAQRVFSLRARVAARGVAAALRRWKRRRRNCYLYSLNLKDGAQSSGYGANGGYGRRNRLELKPHERWHLQGSHSRMRELQVEGSERGKAARWDSEVASFAERRHARHARLEVLHELALASRLDAKGLDSARIPDELELCLPPIGSPGAVRHGHAALPQRAAAPAGRHNIGDIDGLIDAANHFLKRTRALTFQSDPARNHLSF